MKERLTRDRLTVDYFKNDLSAEVNRSLSMINNTRKSRIINRTNPSLRASRASHTSTTQAKPQPSQYLNQFNQVIRNYREKKHSEMLESQDITVSGVINSQAPATDYSPGLKVNRRVMVENPVSNIPRSRKRISERRGNPTTTYNGGVGLQRDRFGHDMPTMRTSRSYNNLRSNPVNVRGSELNPYSNGSRARDYASTRIGNRQSPNYQESDYNPEKFKDFIQNTFPANSERLTTNGRIGSRFGETDSYSRPTVNQKYGAKVYQAYPSQTENYNRPANYLRVKKT